MKRFLSLISLFVICCLSFCPVKAQQTISLAGLWDFCVGDQPVYNDYVMLPGSMLTNGKGDPVSVKTQWTGCLYDSSFYFNPYMEKYRHEGNMKFPFFLTPERHYVGKAMYRRTVYVPAAWKGRRMTLFLERPHIETTVYINGKEAGHRMSLSVPHEYDVTEMLRAGERNEVTVIVDNRIEGVCVGQDSHSVTDQTQGNWNGIVGRMELQARPKSVTIRSVRVFPDLEHNIAQILVNVDKEPDVRIFAVRALARSTDGHEVYTGTLTGSGESFLVRLNMTDSVRLWDEFSPVVYSLEIQAGDDIYETQFGMREIDVQGRQITINGRPLFLRGTVENCCFPETGYPPTDEQEWRRIFNKCKEYGLNHVRFHSYCPPEAAFAAADQVGIYLQPEGPSWPNHGVKLYRGMAIDKYLMEETKRIIDTYGNHPSFVMMAAGNEPAGDWVSFCNDWVKEMKDYDPTRIYAGASVGGGWAWDSGSQYHVKGGARGLDEWNRRAPSSDDDYYSGIEYPRNYKPEAVAAASGAVPPNQTPIIAHEQGQWCAFPDFKEIPQYTGAYRAGNFEIFRDLLRDNGMEQMAEKFLMASGRLQTLCYKYEIERNLRTKDYAGFQLLGLNDYSGQGSALVGVLNVHWREKGYSTASEWRQFCSPVVPLARFPKFVYTDRDTLVVPVEVYNAYYGEFPNISCSYTIADGRHQLIAEGHLAIDRLPIGKNHVAGTVTLPLDSVTTPGKYTLTVSLSEGSRNSWEFWVYPHHSQSSIPDSQSSIYISDSLDEKAERVLQKGGTVLLTAAGKVTLGSDIRQNYLPVFWNTSWFKMRPPHTTGAYIDNQHPLFSYGFPTDDWANLNWWELLNRAQVMNLMELPADYQSPIQPIDTWHVSRKLGMLIEARVGKGRLLMTTMDITTDLDLRVVARQMRKAIISYMQSRDFNPQLRLTPETIRHFFTRQAPPVNMFTNDSPDELKPKLTNN